MANAPALSVSHPPLVFSTYLFMELQNVLILGRSFTAWYLSAECQPRQAGIRAWHGPLAGEMRVPTGR